MRRYWRVLHFPISYLPPSTWFDVFTLFSKSLHFKRMWKENSIAISTYVMDYENPRMDGSLPSSHLDSSSILQLFLSFSFPSWRSKLNCSLSPQVYMKWMNIGGEYERYGHNRGLSLVLSGECVCVCVSCTKGERSLEKEIREERFEVRETVGTVCDRNSLVERSLRKERTFSLLEGFTICMNQPNFLSFLFGGGEVMCPADFLSFSWSFVCHT